MVPALRACGGQRSWQAVTARTHDPECDFRVHGLGHGPHGSRFLRSQFAKGVDPDRLRYSRHLRDESWKGSVDPVIEEVDEDRWQPSLQLHRSTGHLALPSAF